MSDEVKNESDDETTDAGEMPVVAPQNVMDRVERINVEEEMQRAYIDYSMSVIVGRALPDVRDGLKPGNRRILFAMRERGWTHAKAFVKCAKVVAASNNGTSQQAQRNVPGALGKSSCVKARSVPCLRVTL